MAKEKEPKEKSTSQTIAMMRRILLPIQSNDFMNQQQKESANCVQIGATRFVHIDASSEDTKAKPILKKLSPVLLVVIVYNHRISQLWKKQKMAGGRDRI
jgi:hypothetical protein